MDGIRISDIGRDDNGHWQAIVSSGDDPVIVSRRYGSWLTDDGRRELVRELCAELQARVRPLERRERLSRG